jgi:hypothetical protein
VRVNAAVAKLSPEPERRAVLVLKELEALQHYEIACSKQILAAAPARSSR